MRNDYCETECYHQRCEACGRKGGRLYRPVPVKSGYMGGRQSGYWWVTRAEENIYFSELEHSRNVAKNRR